MLNTRQPVTRAEVYVLMGVMLAAALFRLHSLGDLGGLWLDEIWTVLEATGRAADALQIGASGGFVAGNVWDRSHWTGLIGVWSGMGAELHPPLPAVLLRAWMSAVGTSDAAVRLFSVVCSILSIGVMYAVARRTVGVAGGLWAVALLAVAFGPVYFAMECRSYMLLQLLSMGLMWSCVRIVETGGLWRFVLAGTLLLLSALTHYYFVGGAVGLMLYAMLSGRRESRWSVLAAGASAAAAFTLLWGRQLMQQRTNWAFDSHLNDPQFNVSTALLRALAVPGRVFSPAASASDVTIVSAGLFVLIGGAFACWKRPGLRVWGAYLLGGVAMLFVADWVRGARSLDFPRYSIALSPAVCVIVASILAWPRSGLNRVFQAPTPPPAGEPESPGVGNQPPAQTVHPHESTPAMAWSRRLLASLPCLIALGLSLWLTPSYAYQAKGGWKGFSAVLDARIGPGDVIVYHSDGANDWKPYAMLFCFSYYSQNARTAEALIWRGGDPLPPDVLEKLHGRRVWVLTGRPMNVPSPNLSLQEEETFSLPFPIRSEGPGSVRVMRGE